MPQRPIQAVFPCQILTAETIPEQELLAPSCRMLQFMLQALLQPCAVL